MVIIVMGVSGSGKTTLGQQLAASLKGEFQDADWFHAPEQITKMRQGIPLTDADRLPWLERLRVQVKQWQTDQNWVVLACSALKVQYRQHLDPRGELQWVYLRGSYELLQERLTGRQGHYMPVTLLQSQLEALEEPEDAIVVDAALPIPVLVQQVQAQLPPMPPEKSPTES